MENRNFMTVDEVAKELKVSKSYAYKIVKQLNEKINTTNKWTVMIWISLRK